MSRSPVLVAGDILKVYQTEDDSERRTDMTRKLESLIETMHHMAPELAEEAWKKLTSLIAYDSFKYGENPAAVALLRGEYQSIHLRGFKVSSSWGWRPSVLVRASEYAASVRVKSEEEEGAR